MRRLMDTPNRMIFSAALRQNIIHCIPPRRRCRQVSCGRQGPVCECLAIGGYVPQLDPLSFPSEQHGMVSDPRTAPDRMDSDLPPGAGADSALAAETQRLA